jgi:hypothetical protein
LLINSCAASKNSPESKVAPTLISYAANSANLSLKLTISVSTCEKSLTPKTLQIISWLNTFYNSSTDSSAPVAAFSISSKFFSIKSASTFTPKAS